MTQTLRRGRDRHHAGRALLVFLLRFGMPCHQHRRLGLGTLTQNKFGLPNTCCKAGVCVRGFRVFADCCSRSRRRRGLVAVLAIVLAVAVSACGSEDKPAGAAGAADRASAFPVTIAHRHGSTQIASEPKRVVTVGFNEHDFVLALGVKPVAVREWFGERPSATWSWARAELGTAKPHVIKGDLNYERIAALAPDLILGIYGGIDKSAYAKLSKIAPTVVQAEGTVDYGAPWQQQLRMTGKALGRSERAEEIVKDLEQRVAAAREANPQFAGKTAAVIYKFDRFGVYASADPRSRLLTALGFRIPEAIDKLAGSAFFAELSNERLRLVDQDVVVTYGPTPDKRSDVRDNPLYKRLDAVREGRDIYLDGEDALIGALSFSSPLSLPYALEQLVPRLVSAVDGDPATKVAEAP